MNKDQQIYVAFKELNKVVVKLCGISKDLRSLYVDIYKIQDILDVKAVKINLIEMEERIHGVKNEHKKD